MSSVISLGNTVKISYAPTERYNVRFAKALISCRPKEGPDDAHFTGLWTNLLQDYFPAEEGFTAWQDRYFKDDKDGTPRSGFVVPIQQDIHPSVLQDPEYRNRDGVTFRHKWACFIYVKNSSTSPNFEEAVKEQTDYIAKASGKDGADFPNANGYVGGIISFGTVTKFYEYRHVGGGKFDVNELRSGGSGVPLGEADIINDVDKVHEGFVTFKRKSAESGI